MKTIKKENSSKRVNISNNSNMVVASYVQVNAIGIEPNGKIHFQEQVLETKFFANVRNAEKWAAKILAA